MTASRGDLVAAQVAVLEHQDHVEQCLAELPYPDTSPRQATQDWKAILAEEQPEKTRREVAFYDLAEQLPWYCRLGVPGAATRELNRRRTRGGRDDRR